MGIKDQLQKGAKSVGDFINQKIVEMLQPIYANDISDDLLRHERVIRIVNYDKRLNREDCKDSIGFYQSTPGRRIPTFYTNCVETLGLSFYPHLSESVFIADPAISGNYIEIDEYFNYMKQVRVNELTVIAQSLGAKHVDILLKTQSKKTIFQKTGANIDVGKIASANAKATKSSHAESSLEIWASTDFKTALWSSSPALPTVLYFKHESDIQSLIQMVLVNKSKLKSRTYHMRASSSSGVSSTEAASIGASLKSIKVKAGATFEKSAKIENESVLEYTITF